MYILVEKLYILVEKLYILVEKLYFLLEKCTFVWRKSEQNILPVEKNDKYQVLNEVN